MARSAAGALATFFQERQRHESSRPPKRLNPPAHRSLVRSGVPLPPTFRTGWSSSSWRPPGSPRATMGCTNSPSFRIDIGGRAPAFELCCPVFGEVDFTPDPHRHIMSRARRRSLTISRQSPTQSVAPRGGAGHRTTLKEKKRTEFEAKLARKVLLETRADVKAACEADSYVKRVVDECSEGTEDE